MFQEVLDKTDALLYVDTDVLFVRPLDDMWAFWKQFNSTQLAGVAPEHEPSGAGAGWYNRFARHPYYGELGTLSSKHISTKRSYVVFSCVCCGEFIIHLQ